MVLEASVIIPTYNKAPYLSVVLETIAQQADSRFEIIVVDDGSTDNTKHVVRRFNVIYAEQQHQGFGLARARNNGARRARSNYLIFLDDDIRVCSDYLSNALDGKLTYGTNTVQAGYVWDYTGKGDPDVRTQWGVWERPGILTKRFYHINGGNFGIYKSLYWRAGGNDDDLTRGGVEDILFGYRTSLVHGTYVVYNCKMEGFHLPHPKSWTNNDQAANWEIVKVKYPLLYQDYIINGIR